jgi:hypothetical protein
MNMNSGQFPTYKSLPPVLRTQTVCEKSTKDHAKRKDADQDGKLIPCTALEERRKESYVPFRSIC